MENKTLGILALALYLFTNTMNCMILKISALVKKTTVENKTKIF